MDAHDRNEPEISETSRGPAFTRRSFLAGAASVPLSLLLANRLPALAGGAAPTLTGTQAACALPICIVLDVKQQLEYSQPVTWRHNAAFLSYEREERANVSWFTLWSSSNGA